MDKSSQRDEVRAGQRVSAAPQPALTSGSRAFVVPGVTKAKGTAVPLTRAGTVTSPLVPWTSCGAYMSGVLGVPTVHYLPYAFFNLLNPFVAVVFGFTGFRVEHRASDVRVELPLPEPVASTADVPARSS